MISQAQAGEAGIKIIINFIYKWYPSLRLCQGTNLDGSIAHIDKAHQSGTSPETYQFLLSQASAEEVWIKI